MLTAESITVFLKDDARFNILLDNEQQFEEEFIEQIIAMTYKEVGARIPAFRNSSAQIPDMIMLHGVLGNLMRSESFLELRNQLQYSDNNLSSVSIYHKHTNYLALSESLKAEFKQMLNDLAAASFLEAAWGGTTSNSTDYDAIYAFYGNDFFGTTM